MAKKYSHLRDRARQWRQEGHSLTTICDRLKLSKGTVYYWIKDIPGPEGRTKAQSESQKKASAANKKKYTDLRESAYREAADTAEDDLQEQELRDFVVTYLGEGYRRCRNQVAVGNSNPAIVLLSHKIILKHTRNKMDYQLQCHQDNNEKEICTYWGKLLGVHPEEIKVRRKSNSGNLSGRNWRSVHGVLTVRTNDTYFRARLQAWMDCVQKEWLKNCGQRA